LHPHVMIQETARMCKVQLACDCLEMPMTTAFEQALVEERQRAETERQRAEAAEAELARLRKLYGA
jgi:hypothetical protein